MSNTIISHLNMQIELDNAGATIISGNGEVIRVNCDGKLLPQRVIDKVNFDFMGRTEQRIAKEWYLNRKQKGINEDKENNRREFFDILDAAVSKVNKEYYIANVEASIDKNGRIYYKDGEKVAVGLTGEAWKIKATEFAPEYGSDLASNYQYVLWIAYRIAKGFWTVEYVCDDSSSQGNYFNAPGSSHKLETSGARTVGGARNGVGNTCKVVTSANGFCWFGGWYSFDGSDCPVGCYTDVRDPKFGVLGFGSGVLVLNRVRGI